MKLKQLANITVGEIEQRDPVKVSEHTTLLEVVGMLESALRGAVVVQDADGKLSGIFTERDLMLRVTHSNKDWHKTPVKEVMTRNPVCVAEYESIASALGRMNQGTFRHLPRIDAEGRPSGLLSVRDVLSYVAENFPAEFLNLPPDPDHEAKEPWGG